MVVLDTIGLLAKTWPKVASFRSPPRRVRPRLGWDRWPAASRKAVHAAAGAVSIEIAKDLNKLRPEHVLQTLKRAAGQPDLKEDAEHEGQARYSLHGPPARAVERTSLYRR